MSERASPAEFAPAAAGALAPVAGQVEKAKEQALAGTLRIDLESARVILGQLAALRLRAGDLVRACAELDTPLRFGDNWVGRLVAERLRTVAVDRDAGVTPVLAAFHQVLDDLEATVRFAAGVYAATDDRAAADLVRAASRFGVRVEEAR
jgi:hypothetical protein